MLRAAIQEKTKFLTTHLIGPITISQGNIRTHILGCQRFLVVILSKNSIPINTIYTQPIYLTQTLLEVICHWLILLETPFSTI